MIPMRRLLVACAAALLAEIGALGPTIPVSAETSPQPWITSLSPSRAATGQLIRVTITGSNLANTSSIATNPPIGSQTFVVFNDSTVLVALPTDTPPGTYTIQLTTPAGTAIAPAVLSIVPNPPAATSAAVGGGAQPAAGTQAPSLEPAPVAVASTAAPVIPGQQATAGNNQRQPATSSVYTQTRASLTDSPFFALAVGIAVGGLLYALWGKEGRLRVARRRGFFAQLWARPLQRLKLARVCFHCGRLHYVIGTRRDLWSAGEFCSATCFVGDQEQAMATASAEGVAPTRLRGIGVYTDLEVTLKEALRAEASAHGAAMFTEEITHQHNPALFTPPKADGEAGATAVHAGATGIDAPDAPGTDAPSGPAGPAAALDDDPIHVIAPPAIQLSA